ncbi:hypothetical protein B0H66DRAFT_542661 [Apodospora peruviana]|uniref:RNA recognition motif-containing protein n=1 Tax=Apodospora peruviana TaxID=516989 RepID=A0AAE0ISA5_9PEZI|nr:hypothetical protein B0H66DRAFT_542661 [Apodospora peruviana]
MAARPGEDNVATLFGDIHYFYGPPTDDPPHHRFDKGSYIYLFEDANQGRARVEVANRPGTDDQDAFDGYLDRAHLQYSYEHTCLVTLIVGDSEGHEEWHLPTYDPHNQAKYHYKLHSLDIYFWKQQDALQFVNGIRRVLPSAQCEILDEPVPPPRQETEISSVVQKLEKAAIADNNSPQSGHKNSGGAPYFAGPPISAVSGVGDGTPPPPPPPGAPPAFVPMAYNPAAPAAPEQVRHREKTPPPEDVVPNPLHQTLAYDAATPFSPGLVPSGLGPLSPGIPPPNLQHPPGAPSFPAPPQHSVASPGFAPQGFGLLGAVGGHPTGLSQHPTAPPQHPGLARSATMPVAGMPSPGLASPGLASPYGSVFPGHHSVGGYTPGSHTPTPPTGGMGSPPPAPQSLQQGAGYGHNAATASEYSVHQQFYTPDRPRGKLEEHAGKLERGATGLFKKLEKRFG